MQLQELGSFEMRYIQPDRECVASSETIVVNPPGIPLNVTDLY